MLRVFQLLHVRNEADQLQTQPRSVSTSTPPPISTVSGGNRIPNIVVHPPNFTAHAIPAGDVWHRHHRITLNSTLGEAARHPRNLATCHPSCTQNGPNLCIRPLLTSGVHPFLIPTSGICCRLVERHNLIICHTSMLGVYHQTTGAQASYLSCIDTRSSSSNDPKIVNVPLGRSVSIRTTPNNRSPRAFCVHTNDPKP